MGSWVVLTEADVTRAMAGPEATGYRAELLASGETDPLPGIVASVVAEVRDSVRSCAKNVLPLRTDTIPPGAVHHAVAIARYRLLTRTGMDVGEDRRREWEAAGRFLERIARCEQYVEPDEDAAGSPGSTLKMVSGNERQMTRSKMRGL
jgi:phage gp36-like protein